MQSILGDCLVTVERDTAGLRELHMQPFEHLMTTWEFRLGNVLSILTVSLPSPASSYTTSVHGSSQRGCAHSIFFQMQGI